MDKVKIILKKEIPPLKLDKGILSVSILDIIEGTYDDMFYKIINIISNNGETIITPSYMQHKYFDFFDSIFEDKSLLDGNEYKNISVKDIFLYFNYDKTKCKALTTPDKHIFIEKISTPQSPSNRITFFNFNNYICKCMDSITVFKLKSSNSLNYSKLLFGYKFDIYFTLVVIVFLMYIYIINTFGKSLSVFGRNIKEIHIYGLKDIIDNILFSEKDDYRFTDIVLENLYPLFIKFHINPHISELINPSYMSNKFNIFIDIES